MAPAGRRSSPASSSRASTNIFSPNANRCCRHRAGCLAVADGEGRNSVWLAEQGLDVHAIDFSPTAQDKARALALEHGVNVISELADAHNWTYPEAAYDVVCEIFTQFSTPSERALKWAGMRKALKPGGLLIIQGYTLKQQGDRNRPTNSTQDPC